MIKQKKTAPNKTTTHFHLVRHGETLWNQLGRLQGRRDVSLSPEGYKMAYEKAKIFEKLPLAFIGTSPLLRAKMTGYIISQHLGIPNVAYLELNARKFGSWEGKTLNKIRAENRELFNEMLTWNLDKLYVQSPHDYVESYESVSKRALGLMKNIAQIYQNQHILLVTHCGLLTALMLAMKVTENEIPILELTTGHLHMSYCDDKFVVNHIEGLVDPSDQISDKTRKRFFIF